MDELLILPKQCWLGDTIVSLPDVRTEDDKVAAMLHSWITELVSNYSGKRVFIYFCNGIEDLIAISVDGLRIDSVFNVDPGFWPGFNSSAGVFCIGEGSTRNATELCPLQDSLNGLLNYPLFVHYDLWISSSPTYFGTGIIS